MSSPTEPKRRRCKLCPAEILFVRTSEGEIMPLDLKAQVYEVVTDLTGQTVCQPVDRAYVSHFYSCPKANQFSRSKKGER